MISVYIKIFFIASNTGIVTCLWFYQNDESGDGVGAGGRGGDQVEWVGGGDEEDDEGGGEGGGDCNEGSG